MAFSLKTNDIPYEKVPKSEVAKRTAKVLADEKVVGWFQGRMEFGPRALGARSIIGDPRSQNMQSIMNLKIKLEKFLCSNFVIEPLKFQSIIF